MLHRITANTLDGTNIITGKYHIHNLNNTVDGTDIVTEQCCIKLLSIQLVELI